MIKIESGDLTFKEDSHEYFVDGLLKRSVTKVLAEAGVIDKKYFNEHAAQRGRAVHKAIHLMLENKLDMNSVDSRISGYLNAAKSAIRDLNIETEIIEKSYYHDEWDICGTLDFVGKSKGNLILIDWKTGSPLDNYERLQSIMYQGLYEFNEFPHRITKRIIAHLRADGQYRLKSYLDYAKDMNDARYILQGGNGNGNRK